MESKQFAHLQQTILHTLGISEAILADLEPLYIEKNVRYLYAVKYALKTNIFQTVSRKIRFL